MRQPASLALPASLRAHGDIHVRIAALTASIAQDPSNAALYLARGELHRAHRDWDRALSDYRRAARLDPGMAAADLCGGRALLSAGRAAQARTALERFLAKLPGHPEGHALLARAFVSLGNPLRAAEHGSLVIALREEPRPEDFVDRAQALAAAGPGHLSEALRGLDEGIALLGPLVSLQSTAIELELARGDKDAALARLETLASQGDRPSVWSARRSEILEQAGFACAPGAAQGNR